MLNQLGLLGIEALFPVLLALLFYLLEKKSPFGALRFSVRQVIIGLGFGVLSCLATVFGPAGDGYVLNVRNAVSVTAGLVFSAPAALIAAFIGGSYRLLSTLWGTGGYTWLACSLSTFLAGVITAFCRKHIFDDERPNLLHGFFIGFTSEIIHMLLVFLTHMNDVEGAFTVVKACSMPMVLVNSLSVALALAVISLLSGDWKMGPRRSTRISQTLAMSLYLCIIISEVLACAFLYQQEGRLNLVNAAEQLERVAEDTARDIEDIESSYGKENSQNLFYFFGENSHYWKDAASGDETVKKEDRFELQVLSGQYKLQNICLFDDTGTILLSSDPSLENQGLLDLDLIIGDGSGGEILLTETELKHDGSFFFLGTDSSGEVYHLCIRISEKKFALISYLRSDYEQGLNEELQSTAEKRHVGIAGYVFLADADTLEIISKPHEMESTEGLAQMLFLLPKESYGTMHTVTDESGKSYAVMVKKCDSRLIIAALPMEEVYHSRDVSSYMGLFSIYLVFATVFVIVYIMVNKLVVRDVEEITGALARISQEDLETRVDVHHSLEFSQLSEDINQTVAKLKGLIADASARIDRELELARTIQHSALPSVFPAFPNRKEIDIYAYMKPAKEVGGDFYDFCFLNDHTLMFLAADVSGKGIPAALFMMRARTLLRAFSESGCSPAQAMEEANSKLCSENDAEMFVTVWMGWLDVNTGELRYVNGGHNPPVLCRSREGESLLKDRSGLMLGCIDGIRYKEYSLTLAPGDGIFLYTDGVTEARRKDGEMYGEERMLNVLSTLRRENAQTVCTALQEKLARFMDQEPQFDDITMLCVRYRALPKEITLPAQTENFEALSAFLDEVLTEIGCPDGERMRLNVAADELFANVCSYAYAPGSGNITVQLSSTGEKAGVKLRFVDEGAPFNPLEQKEPDLELPAEEREIGGLGIFMVKKSMDLVEYERKDGKNVVTLTKYFRDGAGMKAK